MAVIGPRDTSLLALPVGWDGAELEKLELQDGTTYAQVAQELEVAVGGLNNELASDPIWSAAASFTNIPEWEYRQGTSNGVSEFDEYSRPDPRRGDTTGHMLPLKAYDRNLQWTWRYLEQARMNQIEADIMDAIKDFRDIFRKKVLTRVLKASDDTGAALGLGSGGISPGFAHTAGSTGVDFTPPSFGGTNFASTHEHYVPLSGGVWTAAAIKDVRAELREHGHEAPYTLWISASDIDTFTAPLSGFVPVAQWGVNYASTVSLAQGVNGGLATPTGAYVLGVIEECQVVVIPGMPQYYGFGFKSYGANSQRNPLKIRLPKGLTRPTVRVMRDPRAGSGNYPLQDLMMFFEFGVGVGDRTAGTPRYVNNSSWSDGTAT
jgi:hypothetical protein